MVNAYLGAAHEQMVAADGGRWQQQQLQKESPLADDRGSNTAFAPFGIITHTLAFEQLVALIWENVISYRG